MYYDVNLMILEDTQPGDSPSAKMSSRVMLLPIPTSRPQLLYYENPVDLRLEYMEAMKNASSPDSAEERRDVTRRLAASGALQIMEITFMDATFVKNRGAGESTGRFTTTCLQLGMAAVMAVAKPPSRESIPYLEARWKAALSKLKVYGV